MKTNVIVDGMNIAFRSTFIYDQQQGLTNSEGVPTGTIYGFARHLVKLRDRFPNADLWVAWEGRNSHAMRREVYADYKANRKTEPTKEGKGEADDEAPDTRKVVYDQITILQDLLQAVGVHQVSAYGYEADDVIATLVRGPLKDDKNIIVSSDRDLLQLVNSNTVQMTPREKFYDAFKVEEEYGVPPKLMLAYRTLDGDKSDNLPGMYRFPRKKIANIIVEHDGNLESIYTDCKVTLTEFQRNTLTEFEEQAYVNRKVMALKDVEDYEERRGEYDGEFIDRVCDTLDIESIVADLRSLKVSSGFVKTGEAYVGLLYSTS